MFTKIVVFWNYDNAIEYVTPQLCCIFLLYLDDNAKLDDKLLNTVFLHNYLGSVKYIW